MQLALPRSGVVENSWVTFNLLWLLRLIVKVGFGVWRLIIRGTSHFLFAMASPCWVWNFGRASRENSLFICYGFASLYMLAFAFIFFDMNGSRRSCCSGDVRSVLFKLFNLGIGFKFEFWIWWSLSFCLKEDLRKEKKEKRKKKKEKRKRVTDGWKIFIVDGGTP